MLGAGPALRGWTVRLRRPRALALRHGLCRPRLRASGCCPPSLGDLPPSVLAQRSRDPSDAPALCRPPSARPLSLPRHCLHGIQPGTLSVQVSPCPTQLVSVCLSGWLAGCLSSLGAQPTFVFVPSIRRSRLSRLLPPSERAHPALSCPSSSSPFRVPPGSPDLPAATWPSGCHRRSLIPSWLKAKLLPKRPIVLADAASSAPDPPCPRPPLVLARLRSALEPSSGR